MTRRVLQALLLAAPLGVARAQTHVASQCSRPPAELVAGAATRDQVTTSATYRSGPAPRFPTGMLAAKVEGKVTFEFVIDTLGRANPCSIRVVAVSDSAFIAPARATIEGAVFTPALLGTQRVAMVATQTVHFRIGGN